MIIEKKVNNIKLLLNKNRCIDIVCILFLINIGSRSENNGITGISHFLEHLFFKGCDQYPNHDLLLESINKIGGIVNAFTSFEYTGYYIIVPKQNYKKALTILYSIIFESLIFNNNYKKYLEDKIKKEKKVVINENKKNRSNPMRNIQELNIKNILKKSNMKYGIGGLDKDINQFSLQKIKNYISKYYTNDKCILSLYGNFNEKDILKYFPLHKSIYNKSSKNNYNKIILNYGENKIYKEIYSSAFICIGFPIKRINNNYKNDCTINILANTIAGNMMSILFNELREKNGLVYFISNEYNIFNDFGILQFYCGTYNDIDSIKKTLQIIFNTLSNIKKNGIDKILINNIKEFLLGKKMINNNNSSNYNIDSTIDYIYYNKIYSINDTKKIYKSINENDLLNLSNKLFKKKNCTVSLITDKKININTYKNIL